MQSLPHRYTVTATTNDDYIDLRSAGLERLESSAPAEFGGPGDRWSPETLLVAAVADCFLLTFKSIARASKLEWESLSCQVDGVLDRVDRVTQFTSFALQVELDIPHGSDKQKAQRILEKSEHACLITNSLSADSTLEITVRSSDNTT